MAMNMQAMLRIVAQVEGQNALQRLGAELAGVGQKAGSTLSPFGKLNGAMRGIADVASTIGLAAVGRELVNAGSESLAATTRIKALATSYGEVGPLTNVAAKAAREFALGNVDARNSVADLYGRLRPMGVTLKDVETVFFGVNKAAKVMGLGTEDVNGVMLQLSQALGSGKLQGDELRSIMERMPAVGQAVAKVMGVSASEIKKLGSEGKITTEIMIQAAAELNKLQPPPPTAMQQFEKAMKDLRTELGENLLPILTPFVVALTGLVRAFMSLPEPIQTAVVALGALAIAAGPIASVVTGIGNAMIVLGGLKIGATIAGWAGAIIPFKAALVGLLSWISSTMIPGLLAFFSGPIGWTVLAVAAVVAMAIAFRKPLGDFLNWLWEWGKPISNFWKNLWDGTVKLARSAVEAVKSVFIGIGAVIKGAFNGILRNIFNSINRAINNINFLITRANALSAKVRGPQLPTLPTLSVPQFAQGGVVSGPTLAMVGEGGEPEYIIPASKMAKASMNYLNGARGNAVIPAYAAGGFVGGNAQINVTTGPVLQQGGQQYVTVADLEKAMRKTADGVYASLRTPAGRYAVGVR